MINSFLRRLEFVDWMKDMPRCVGLDHTFKYILHLMAWTLLNKTPHIRFALRQLLGKKSRVRDGSYRHLTHLKLYKKMH